MEHSMSKLIRCSKNSSKRQVNNDKTPIIRKKDFHNNLTLHLKELEKEEQMKPKISRRKEIKIRVEIKEI